MKKITLTDEEKFNKSLIDLGSFGSFSVSFADDAVEIDGFTVAVDGTYFMPDDYVGKDETLYINLLDLTEDDIETWTDIYMAEWETVDI